LTKYDKFRIYVRQPSTVTNCFKDRKNYTDFECVELVEEYFVLLINLDNIKYLTTGDSKAVPV